MSLLLFHVLFIEIIPTEDMLSKEKSHKPLPVIILDRSGSMGAWCEYMANNCVPNALEQVGYSENDQCVLITFDSIAERVKYGGKDPTLKELKTSVINCRGSTNMLQVIKLLKQVLTSEMAKSYHIIVLSDGGVGDQAQTSEAAQRVVKELPKKIKEETRISATLIRFMSSTYAQPDTRALTCVNLFCNNNEVTQLVDVSNGGGVEEVGVLNLIEAIVSGCKSSGIQGLVKVSCSEEGVMFRPSPASPQVPSCDVAASGEKTFLLCNKAIKSIKLGDNTFEVYDAGNPKDVAVLNSFVNVVGTALKMSIIASGKSGVSAELKDKIQRTIGFFDEVQSFIQSLQHKALEDNNVGVAARAKAVVKSLKGRTTSAIDALRQQLNADRVAGLNSQQAADWLRGVSADTKGGKNLARRVDGSDYEKDSRNAITSLNNALQSAKDLPGDDQDLVSFYSQSSFPECIRTVEELAIQVDNIGLGDWMQCVGGLGVPFEAFIGNYTDCWTMRIKPDNLFVGQCLAEPDVWLTTIQAGNNTTALQCPGRPDSSITGVICLRSTCPEFYDLYMQKGRALAEMQCSAMMRKAVACIPYDIIALNTAGVWSLFQKGVLSSLEKQVLNDLVANIKFLIGKAYKEEPFHQLFESLCKEDPRPYLTGDLNVSNILKCVASILRYADDKTNLKAAFRAMLYLEGYQVASRVYKAADGPAQRKAALNQLLGIDLEKNGTKCKPLFEEEPENPKHYDQVNLEVLKLPDWIPSFAPFVSMHSFLHNGQGDNADVFGVDHRTFQTLLAVQSLQAEKEPDRVDTEKRVALMPDILDKDKAIEYLRKVQVDIYAADYQARVSAKKAEEEKERTKKQVDELYDAATLEAFLELLGKSVITNRDHPGFPMLLEKIAKSDNAPVKLPKLCVLITGRDISKDMSVPVFANGNFFAGDWKQYEKLFLPKAAKAWEKVLACHEKYGVYKYPKGSGKNRHGHSDEFPSFWAMGYKSLYHFQQSASAEVFNKYIDEHCKQKGCCTPSISVDRLLENKGNNNNNDNDNGAKLPRPLTAQEKTDAKRARKAAKGVKTVKKNAKKGANSNAAVPAKPKTPAVKEGKE